MRTNSNLERPNGFRSVCRTLCADLLEQKVLTLGSAEQCRTPRGSSAARGLCFGWLQWSSEVGVPFPQKDLGSVDRLRFCRTGLPD